MPDVEERARLFAKCRPLCGGFLISARQVVICHRVARLPLLLIVFDRRKKKARSAREHLSFAGLSLLKLYVWTWLHKCAWMRLGELFEVHG